VKLDVLRNSKILAGSRIRVDADLSLETRKIRRRLIPYLKNVTRRGNRAILKKDKLVLSGRTCDLEYLLKDIQLETGSGVDNPAVTGSRECRKLISKEQ
jgi:hypothetical protein